jgi:hypothetical protein
MNGWPDNTAPNATISTDTEMGSIRCRITSSAPSATAQEYDLTITNAEGSFVNGDWAMMIQMSNMTGNPLNAGTQDALYGKYTLVVIQNASAGAFRVKPYSSGTYSNPYHAWSFRSDAISYDRVQLVKVSKFWNLTINGGIITCPKYDHAKGTGGIIPIMVGNNFVMTDGFINASAAGFSTYTYPISKLGEGGKGALAVASTPFNTSPVGLSGVVNQSMYPGYGVPPIGGVIGAQAYGYPDAPLCIKPGGNTSQTLISSYAGGNGHLENSATVSPAINTCNIFRIWTNHSNLSKHQLNLGCSGAVGTRASTGGGAGGYGGNGGASNIPAGGLGQAGGAGENGQDGGPAPDGGVGGGIVYLKVANSSLSFPDSRPRIYAQASNGPNGSNGGHGGKGGSGGAGADGLCGITLVAPGGWGGFGDGGMAGSGGDGAGGGCGGTVWILKKASGTHHTFAPYVNNKTGQGGIGGASGYTYTHIGVKNARNYSAPLQT